MYFLLPLPLPSQTHWAATLALHSTSTQPSDPGLIFPPSECAQPTKPWYCAPLLCTHTTGRNSFSVISKFFYNLHILARNKESKMHLATHAGTATTSHCGSIPPAQSWLPLSPLFLRTTPQFIQPSPSSTPWPFQELFLLRKNIGCCTSK